VKHSGRPTRTSLILAPQLTRPSWSAAAALIFERTYCARRRCASWSARPPTSSSSADAAALGVADMAASCAAAAAGSNSAIRISRERGMCSSCAACARARSSKTRRSVGVACAWGRKTGTVRGPAGPATTCVAGPAAVPGRAARGGCSPGAAALSPRGDGDATAPLPSDPSRVRVSSPPASDTRVMMDRMGSKAAACTWAAVTAAASARSSTAGGGGAVPPMAATSAAQISRTCRQDACTA